MKSVRLSIALIVNACLITVSLDTRQAQAQNRHQNAYGLGMDLVWYCSYRHGNSARLVLRDNNAYGWKCQVGGQDLHIDVGEVCRLMYGSSYQAIMGSFNDSHSWYCQESINTNQSGSSGRNISQFEAEMLELTNSQRRNAGLSPLRLSPQLSQAAQAYAQDASRNPNLPPHIGSDGSSVGNRVTRTGYGFSFVGENVFVEIPRSSPTNAVRWWMSSPGHRANILGQDYQEIGFGYVYNPSDQRHVFVQVFGTPRQQ